MKIILYYTKVADYEEEAAFQRWLPRVEEQRKTQILRTANRRVQARSLAAGALLRQALQDGAGVSAQMPLQLTYGAAGKPALADYPDIHFNLSHSGDYVCCAVSAKPVGVDIQKYGAVKGKIADRFFTEQDNLRLAQQEKMTGRGDEWERLFFRMWSIKESYLKLTGTGLSQRLDSFEIDWEKSAIINNTQAKIDYSEQIQPAAWFWSREKFDGYSICVCGGEEELLIEEKEIDC